MFARIIRELACDEVRLRRHARVIQVQQQLEGKPH